MVSLQTTWSSNQCCQPRRPSQSTKSAPESVPVHPVCRSLAFYRTLLGWRDKDSAAASPTATFPWAIMLIASSHKAQKGHLRATGCRPQPETTSVHGQRTTISLSLWLPSLFQEPFLTERRQCSKCLHHVRAHNRRTLWVMSGKVPSECMVGTRANRERWGLPSPNLCFGGL